MAHVKLPSDTEGNAELRMSNYVTPEIIMHV